MPKLEKDIQSRILKDLGSYPKYIEFWKNVKTSENKNPDIFFTSWLTGPCCIELKKEGERVKGGQLFKLKKLHSNGLRSFAVIGLNGYLKLKKHLKINEANLKEEHDRCMKLYGEWTEEKYLFE